MKESGSNNINGGVLTGLFFIGFVTAPVCNDCYGIYVSLNIVNIINRFTELTC